MKTTKRIFTIVLAFALATASVYGQDMTSKNGTPILPEAGNWSIGLDAVPIAAYFGSLMYASGGGGSAAPAAFKGPLALTGKYMAGANTAYRVRFGINSVSTSTTNKVNDDQADIDAAILGSPPSDDLTEDELKTSTLGVSIGGGIQKFRGKGRVKGYYGGELQFILTGASTEISYGNDFTTLNTTPTSTYDFTNLLDSATAGRTTKTDAGGTFGFGLRGFIGVEYFIAAKVSLSAEYGWGIMMTSASEGSASTEILNATASGGDESAVPTGSGSSFSIANDVGNGFGTGGGAININFYF